MITEAEIRSALNSIVDPCSAAAGVPAGLQDMGLIREVTVAPGHGAAVHIKVVIAVTEYGCLMGAPFAQSAYERLSALQEEAQVEVELDHRFDWHTSDMDPAYRARLDSFRAGHRGKTIPIRPN